MSNNFNAVLTIGRDAEVRHLPSGVSILTVTGANNTGYGDKKKTNWIRVSVFGKKAEGELVKWLKKGQQIFVSGELSVNEYEKDGQTKYSLELNANILDLVGGNRSEQAAPAPVKKPAQPATMDFDDIPFVSLNSQIKNHLI